MYYRCIVCFFFWFSRLNCDFVCLSVFFLFYCVRDSICFVTDLPVLLIHIHRLSISFAQQKRRKQWSKGKQTCTLWTTRQLRVCVYSRDRIDLSHLYLLLLRALIDVVCMQWISVRRTRSVWGSLVSCLLVPMDFFVIFQWTVSEEGDALLLYHSAIEGSRRLLLLCRRGEWLGKRDRWQWHSKKRAECLQALPKLKNVATQSRFIRVSK